MSNFSVVAPCGCEILAWDQGHSTEPNTKLEPCALHGAAEELLAALMEMDEVFRVDKVRFTEAETRAVLKMDAAIRKANRK
jgi:hypothetical protein